MSLTTGLRTPTRFLNDFSKTTMSNSDFQSLVARDYDTITAHGISLPTARYYDETILGYLPSMPGMIVDAGCGTGEFTRKLTSSKEQILAVDVSSVAIRKAQASEGTSRIDYRVAAVEDLPSMIPPRSCSAIILNRVLHHCDDLPTLIEALMALLLPGGRIIVLDLDCTGNACSQLNRKFTLVMYRLCVLAKGLCAGTLFGRIDDLRAEARAYRSPGWLDHLGHEPDYRWTMIRDAFRSMSTSYIHKRMNWRFHLFVADRP